jgi:hypothetical protein
MLKRLDRTDARARARVVWATTIEDCDVEPVHPVPMASL